VNFPGGEQYRRVFCIFSLFKGMEAGGSSGLLPSRLRRVTVLGYGMLNTALCWWVLFAVQYRTVLYCIDH